MDTEQTERIATALEGIERNTRKLATLLERLMNETEPPAKLVPQSLAQ